MIIPSKVIPFNQTVLSKLPLICKQLEKGQYTVVSLFEKTKANFEDINEYITTLEVLFVLNKIDLESETIVYAD